MKKFEDGTKNDVFYSFSPALKLKASKNNEKIKWQSSAS